ncbi:MAG: YggT family protein [Candidatus Neomarinimicrobiota bacterium]
MYVIGNLLIAVGQLLRLGIDVLQLLIFIQVVLSWLNVSLPLNTATRMLYAITEAIYRPIRKLIPTMMGGLDFTPLVALAALFLVDRWLVASLIRLGYQLAG